MTCRHHRISPPVASCFSIGLGILLFIGSACGNGRSHADGENDSPDAPDDAGADTWTDGDTGDVSPETGDAEEDPPECDPSIDGPGYDLEEFGDPVPHERPPTECGECCRQVSFAEYDVHQCLHDVWGRYLVFTTSNHASPGLTRVYLVDLVTLDHYIMAERTFPPLGETCHNGVLRENIFAFLRDQTSTVDGYVTTFLEARDLESGSPSTHPLGDNLLGGSPPYELKYSQGWFAWTEMRETEPEPMGINFMDLATGTERMLDTGSTHDVMDPEMDGDRIVFREWDHRIRLYDISEDAITDVQGGETFDWYRYQPGIWGDYVAWHDLRDGGPISTQEHADIYMKNLVTGEESVVCDHPASQVAALDMGFGLVAWPDLRNDPVSPNDPWGATNFDIYAYRIETGEEIQVTDLPGREVCPRIFENRVYFVMEDGGGIMSIFEKIID